MVIRTNSRDKVDTSVWYKFWEAAVAIIAMCVRKGKNSYWDDLGKSEISIRR